MEEKAELWGAGREKDSLGSTPYTHWGLPGIGGQGVKEELLLQVAEWLTHRF